MGAALLRRETGAARLPANAHARNLQQARAASLAVRSSSALPAVLGGSAGLHVMRINAATVLVAASRTRGTCLAGYVEEPAAAGCVVPAAVLLPRDGFAGHHVSAVVPHASSDDHVPRTLLLAWAAPAVLTVHRLLDGEGGDGTGVTLSEANTIHAVTWARTLWDACPLHDGGGFEFDRVALAADSCVAFGDVHFGQLTKVKLKRRSDVLCVASGEADPAVVVAGQRCGDVTFVDTRACRAHLQAGAPPTPRQRGAVCGLSLLPRDPNYVIAAAMSGPLARWDRRAPRAPVLEYPGYANVCQAVRPAVDETGRLVAIGTEGNAALVWDADSGRRLATLGGLPDVPKSCAFQGEGLWLGGDQSLSYAAPGPPPPRTTLPGAVQQLAVCTATYVDVPADVFDDDVMI